MIPRTQTKHATILEEYAVITSIINSFYYDAISDNKNAVKLISEIKDILMQKQVEYNDSKSR